MDRGTLVVVHDGSGDLPEHLERFGRPSWWSKMGLGILEEVRQGSRDPRGG